MKKPLALILLICLPSTLHAFGGRASTETSPEIEQAINNEEINQRNTSAR